MKCTIVIDLNEYDLLEATEELLYQLVYANTKKNQSETARRLGVSRGTCITKLKRYQLLKTGE